MHVKVKAGKGNKDSARQDGRDLRRAGNLPGWRPIAWGDNLEVPGGYSPGENCQVGLWGGQIPRSVAVVPSKMR